MAMCRRISAKELQSQIGVTYKTAWYVNRRLREVMRIANDKYKLSGNVAMDEAYLIVDISHNSPLTNF